MFYFKSYLAHGSEVTVSVPFPNLARLRLIHNPNNGTLFVPSRLSFIPVVLMNVHNHNIPVF